MTVPPQPTQTSAPLPASLAHLRTDSRDSPPLPGDITGTGREYDVPIAVSQHSRDPSPLRASTTNENSLNSGASRTASSKDGPQTPTPPGTPRPLGPAPRNTPARARPVSMPPQSFQPPTQPSSRPSADETRPRPSNSEGRSRSSRILGDYSMSKTLGAGSMGKVKLAHHLVTKETVCGFFLLSHSVHKACVSVLPPHLAGSALHNLLKIPPSSLLDSVSCD